MKIYKRGMCVILVVILTAALWACGKQGKKAPDPKAASYEEVVVYLKDGGVIADEGNAVDMNTAEGYVTDNTGGDFPVAEIADKAYDYDGLYLLWWDLDNPTDLKENYDAIANNDGVVVIAGGAAVLETAAHSGAYAIAFSEDYADKDKALELFDAMSAE